MRSSQTLAPGKYFVYHGELYFVERVDVGFDDNTLAMRVSFEGRRGGDYGRSWVALTTAEASEVILGEGEIVMCAPPLNLKPLSFAAVSAAFGVADEEDEVEETGYRRVYASPDLAGEKVTLPNGDEATFLPMDYEHSVCHMLLSFAQGLAGVPGYTVRAEPVKAIPSAEVRSVSLSGAILCVREDGGALAKVSGVVPVALFRVTGLPWRWPYYFVRVTATGPIPLGTRLWFQFEDLPAARIEDAPEGAINLLPESGNVNLWGQIWGEAELRHAEAQKAKPKPYSLHKPLAAAPAPSYGGLVKMLDTVGKTPKEPAPSGPPVAVATSGHLAPSQGSFGIAGPVNGQAAAARQRAERVMGSLMKLAQPGSWTRVVSVRYETEAGSPMHADDCVLYSILSSPAGSAARFTSLSACWATGALSVPVARILAVEERLDREEVHACLYEGAVAVGFWPVRALVALAVEAEHAVKLDVRSRVGHSWSGVFAGAGKEGVLLEDPGKIDVRVRWEEAWSVAVLELGASERRTTRREAVRPATASPPAFRSVFGEEGRARPGSLED